MVEPLLYLCFALVAFLLYSNTFQNPYIFDDWHHIEVNPHIQITSLSWDAILGAGFDSPLRFRPVAYITLALNYYFHGLDLAGYHLVNILIHLAAGIFLYMFLRITLSLQQGRQHLEHAVWLPFAAAMIWPGASAARTVGLLYYPKNEQPGGNVLYSFHAVICQSPPCQGDGKTIRSFLKLLMFRVPGAGIKRICGNPAFFYTAL